MLTPAARGRRYASWLPALLLAAAAIAIALGGQEVQGVLRYERATILDLQWWRVLTGNLVHLGATHLVLNLIGMGLVFGLFRTAFTNTAWFAVILVCCMSVSLGLLWFQPEVHWYVGLSGMLHGVFVAGALAMRRLQPRWSALCLAGLAIKIAIEQIGGDPWNTEALTGGPVISSAHLYGALGGLIGIIGDRRRISAAPNQLSS